MTTRTWASAALGGGMGTMLTVYQQHSFFWLCVGEGLLWVAFFLFQRALRQQPEYVISKLDDIAKDVRSFIQAAKAP